MLGPRRGQAAMGASRRGPGNGRPTFTRDLDYVFHIDRRLATFTIRKTLIHEHQGVL